MVSTIRDLFPFSLHVALHDDDDYIKKYCIKEAARPDPSLDRVSSFSRERIALEHGGRRAPISWHNWRMYERHETTPSARGSAGGARLTTGSGRLVGPPGTAVSVQVARVLGGLLLARLFTVITLSPEMMMGRSHGGVRVSGGPIPK